MTQTLVQVNPIYPPTQKALASEYTVHNLWEADDATAFLSHIASDVTGIITDGGSGASAELLRQLPNVGVVSVFGVGVDAVDLEYCKAQGIRVGNTPDVLSDDVADLALALCLACYRRLPFADDYVRQGYWSSKGAAPLTQKFCGSSVGILGLGRIGLAIAKRLEGFDCKISYCNRNPRDDVAYKYYADAKSLADAVDCLVIALAPTPDMAGMIDADVLSALGPTGYLVNVSRGLVVDEAALISALKDQRIAGAGLDVFAQEPVTEPSLLALPNVVLQPHVASGTVQTRQAMGDLVVKNLGNFFQGEDLTASVV